MIKKVFSTCVVGAVVAAIGYGAFAFLNEVWPFTAGEGGAIPVIGTMIADEQVDVEQPPSLVIEIHENRIVYDGDEISLEDLDAILVRFQDVDEIWTLQDAFMADQATWASVADLLRAHGVIFAEQ